VILGPGSAQGKIKVQTLAVVDRSRHRKQVCEGEETDHCPEEAEMEAG
jgi:hypothetical protein